MRSELADLTPRTPTIPIISTTYEDIDTRPVFDAEHWATNMRNPVRFQQAITAAGTDHHTFIEISAHPLLTPGHHRHPGRRPPRGQVPQILEYRDPATRYRRHHHLPDQPLHRRHHAPTTDSAPARAAPSHPHHPLATHPPLDHHPARQHGSAGTSGPQRGCGERALRTTKKRRARRRRARRLVLPAGLAGAPGTRRRHAKQRFLARGGRGRTLRRNGPCRRRGIADNLLAPTELAEESDPTALLDALRGVDNVLYAPPVSGELLDVGAAYQVFHATRRLAAAMVASSLPPKLFILTRNAQPVSEGDRANPGHAVLWGLGRSLALEHPEIWGGIIDLDESMPAELAARHVLAAAQCADEEDQVVYRSGARHVPRLRRTAPTASPVELGPGRPASLSSGLPATSDRI